MDEIDRNRVPAARPVASDRKLPFAFVVIVLLLCALPTVANLFGIDFSAVADDPVAGIEVGAASSGLLHQTLRGSFIHLGLEWSAFAIAVFTVVLAFAHARSHDASVTAIIALALFAAGLVDAFHALAATHIIAGAADSADFIPFTWAVSRVFHAAILLAGVGLVLVAKRTPRWNWGTLLASGALFGSIALLAIQYSARAANLPQTMYPGTTFTRPWDLAPLALFLLGGLVVFPLYHSRYPSAFSQALWLAAIPGVVVQAHMAFGSSALYDNHFVIGHLLKLVAYLVPLAGLTIDYARANRELAAAHRELEAAFAELRRSAADLAAANEELQQFAYVASHDLRSPLRAIDHLSSWIEEDLGPRLDDDNRGKLQLLRSRVSRMDDLLSSLLAYARVGRRDSPAERVDVDKLVVETTQLLGPPLGFEVRTVGELPVLRTSRTALGQVLSNLIGNAIKHHDRSSGVVEISARPSGTLWEFEVRDDGPGIPRDMRDKAFEMFQTLRPRDEIEGSGMGLALVRKQVVTCGGEITCESCGERGTRFRFTWPAEWPRRKTA